MKKANLLLFDGRSFKKIECGNLDDYYKYLECDCFDIANRKIGGKRFDVFVDDEGLLKENPIPTAINGSGNVMLVGNLIFANHDYEGNTTSLSDDDIEIIKKSKVVGFSSNGEMIQLILMDY